MPNVYIRYVTWISRGIRLHGSSWADIAPPTSSVMSPGDIFQAPWAAPLITWGEDADQHNAYFAFWSVKGGTKGALATTKGVPPSVEVGNGDIVAVAWYIDGNPGERDQVLVDAFDVDKGNFVDDPFVTVSPDNSLTARANNEGVVPTASQENICAYSAIQSVPFSCWEVISGNDKKSEDLKVEDESLRVIAHSAGIAFAFYQRPSTPVVIGPMVQDQYAAGTWVSWGVMVDGGGPTGAGPVPSWNPNVKDLAVGLALADAAGKVSPNLRAGVLEIAAKQVSIATESMTKNIKTKMREYEVAAKHSKPD